MSKPTQKYDANNQNNTLWWYVLTNKDISNKYTITLRNKFYAFQEISKIPTLNDEHENFVNVHLEAVAECIPTKLRAKPFHERHFLLKKKNETMWKQHPSVTKGTQLTPMLKNLRHKVN